MHTNPAVICVDVRTKQEYDTGHIPGAILLPDSSVKTQAPYVLPDKNAIIIVYCKGGSRSHTAACDLITMGYTNVYNLGGIDSWPYERE